MIIFGMKILLCTFQPAHNVKTTLYGRWNDVKTLKRRPYNVVLTSCAGWDAKK